MKGGGSFGNVLYGTTKAGVVALTKGLARELAPLGSTSTRSRRGGGDQHDELAAHSRAPQAVLAESRSAALHPPTILPASLRCSHPTFSAMSLAKRSLSTVVI